MQLPPIFVPSRHRRKHTIFDYRNDCIAVIDSDDYSSYLGLLQASETFETFENLAAPQQKQQKQQKQVKNFVIFKPCSIQQKRRWIQQLCNKQKILMIDDDVFITDQELHKLVAFAENNKLAMACYSDFTGMQKPFKTTPCFFLDFARLPEFRTDEVYEDLCLEFECLRQNIPVGCIFGSLKYLYKLGEQSSITNRNERMLNTEKLYPEFYQGGKICQELTLRPN